MNKLGTLELLFEYFDIKYFLQNNSPTKLLTLLGIMAALMIVAYFICEIIRKNILKYAELNAKKGASGDKPAEGQVAHRSIDGERFTKLMKNASLLLYLLIIGWGLHQLVIGPVYKTAIELIFTTLCTLAGINFLTAFIPFEMDAYFRRHGSTLETTQARSLLPIIKGLIWAIGGTFLLDNVGLHVSTIIAGLGIVGVAVGMAGQAILKDFFGYIVILLDKPFKIGDFVELSSGKSGSVTYVGPKTTRLISLEGNEIICANYEMTSGVLVNQGSISEREVEMELGVSYNTPLPVVHKYPDLIRGVIDAFPQCRFERCCLLQFGPANYLFQLIYRVATQPGGLTAFMNTQNQVNLAIYDMQAREHIGGAYPTQTILLTNVTPQPAPAAPTASSNSGQQ